MLQLSRVQVERLDGHDLGTRRAQPASRGGARDAILDGAVDVLCGPDKFPKTVVITILSAGRGSHVPILVPAASRSTLRAQITGVGWLCCRQLAQMGSECCGR